MDEVRSSSFSAAIVESLARYPEREAFVHGARRFTYAEAAQQISQIQQLLAGMGVAHRGQVAVLSKNMPEIWFVQAAAYLLGARYSGMHALGSVNDWAWVCDNAEVEVLIVSPQFAGAGRRVKERTPGIRHLLVIGGSDATENMLALMQQYAPVPLEAGPATAGDTCWLQYTGGTTGTPKGVETSHSAMIQMALVSLAYWQYPSTPRYMATGPISHSSMLPIFPTLSRGGAVVLLEDFDPESVFRTIEKERISLTVMLPAMIYRLLDHPDIATYDLSSLETVLYSSSPIFPSRLKQALEVFGNIFVQAYGQTESVGQGTVLLKEEHDPVNRAELLTACGRPTPGVQLEVHDENGRSLPSGTPGEICLRAPGVMTRYWKNPELTAEVLRDGWLHTGDVGVKDAEGYLHLVDRKKDMVVTGGFTIYPREVENAITEDPAVASVAVVGLPDPKWGEALTAFVVPHKGTNIDPDQVKARVRETKGLHQTPKRVVIVDQLPMTAVGKIDKKALRKVAPPAAGSN